MVYLKKSDVMKKLLLLFLVLLSLTTSFAKIRKITVSNFQFSPSTMNAKVGDTILWVWQEGTHNTISLAIPRGAAPWNAQMNSTHKKFGYIVTKTGAYNYYCSIHASVMKGVINVTAGSGLGDLDISAENAKAVLNWKTNAGSDVASISVQRSTDGKNFTEIASLQPSISGTYKYTDEAIPSGKYIYYQLLLTDKQGNTELSDIKMFTNNQSAAKLITSLSPNPLSKPGHLMLQFNADAPGKMKVQLFTQAGKMLAETEMTANEGLNNGHFHLGDLTPGTYYMICTLGDKTERHTIVYQ
jgi:plastocyanin